MASASINDVPEFNDVQGILLRTYGTKKAARFFFLAVQDKIAARKWLQEMLPEITSVTDKHHTCCVNLAFTIEGLMALDLPKETLNSFSVEFTEGTLTDHRRRMLGDIYKNDPARWDWGATPDAANHILVLVYTPDEPALDAYTEKLKTRWAGSGLTLQKIFDTNLLRENKEHFGFRDGISQPMVAGFGKGEDPANEVAPGEFILGYTNEYKKLPESPRWPKSDDVTLNQHPGDPNYLDLGRNGSYMVFRQLSQDVSGFWNYMDEQASANPNISANTPVHLAAKMIGRWPGGAPVTLCPMQDDPAHATSNQFGYSATDRPGMHCPVGAHVRRSNPRDAFKEKPEDSISFVKRHRLIRKSRPYGKPFSPSLEPGDMIGKPDDGENRGIFFICFNASISRQFEFIQQSWIINPQFDELYEDPDPFTGNQEMEKDSIPAWFHMPGKTVRERVGGVRSFVHTKGSAYLFMPGLKALAVIAGK